MMKFREFRTSLSEASVKLSAGEKQVKKFKVGKGKYDAIVTKKGSDFIAYIDGDMLDKFKSVKDAEKAAKDFIDLMGK